MKNIKERIEIIIPKGYEIEDYLETYDSDFKEDPLAKEEVKITFE